MEKFIETKGRRKFSKVVEICSSSSEVFDVQVEGDHSYIANGFVSHNSAPTIQKFNTKGITSELMSVDKPMDAYDTLKSAIYENRVFFYEYEPLLEELRTIQKDNRKNKVDHPRDSSKDVADALAGITFSLSTMYHGPPMGIIKGLSKTSDPVVSEQQEMVDETDFLMPFVQG